MKTNDYYEKLFSNYPDVVTLPEFREMLGGIGDTTARKLVRAKLVQLVRGIHIAYQSKHDSQNPLVLIRIFPLEIIFVNLWFMGLCLRSEMAPLVNVS